MSGSLTVVNMRSVEKNLLKLDLKKDKSLRNDIRKVLKEPFNDMKKDAKSNLDTMMASSPVSVGVLSRGLSVGSKYSSSRGSFSVGFGGRARNMKSYAEKSGRTKKGAMNHFHLVNSGTRTRYTKKGYHRGAVGSRGTYNPKRTNLAYKTGFADRAIQKQIPTMESRYVNGFNRVFNSIRYVP